ncbi:hypothetical protein [Anabaena azotica]|uniref:Uncharacterized protein n=1 Tax=Anabaena azotica FACHB-119 TaxID=947527 RepID=A0ABR8D9Y9_9NOST|nr:hypothetical protein [Anabaena azotica]MBD2503939.1 hypothetical protein [Anabaena azotica FACHB-119]
MEQIVPDNIELMQQSPSVKSLGLLRGKEDISIFIPTSIADDFSMVCDYKNLLKIEPEPELIVLNYK